MLDRQLAHYRITARLGAGGMGEVYRAEDEKLGRQVAIKVLPESMARDPERLARFDREARALAQLNHPNIAAIYGLEEAEGIRFLVLELVEGETLAERIERGPVPVVEALQTARQVAEGMAGAHAAGILHRDLKPANVKVTPDGKVKVLDFGLAKPFLQGVAVSGDADLSKSPTLTFAGATEAGVLLGTAAYMSPEQARGQVVDRRADIWAFGCVLFELLAGRQPFQGGTVSDTLASILKEDPPWDALRSDLPASARRLLRRALTKDPEGRLHDIADARLEIDEALEEAARGATGADHEGATAAPERAPVIGRLIPWALVAATVAVAVWLGLGRRPPAAPRLPRLQASISMPADQSVDLYGRMAISPDGRQLAYVAVGSDGAPTLWLRSLERGTVRSVGLAGTGNVPFWSPDGRYLAFFDQGKLQKMELATGAVETVVDRGTGLGAGSEGSGGAWNESGDIVFDTYRQGLMHVDASGGAVSPVTEIDFEAGDDAHRWPCFLPDGRHFLFLARSGASGGGAGLRIGSLDGGPVRELFSSVASARYADPGYLVWWADGNLKAQPFDPERLELTGEPRVIASGVVFDPRDGRPGFTLSRNGVLVYREGTDQQPTELVWLDREGKLLGSAAPPGNYYTPRLAPDGRRVAVDISDAENNGDIWILDPARGTRDRITTRAENETGPVWSPPDGKEIVFMSSWGDDIELRRIAARIGAESRTVFQDPRYRPYPNAWLPDGKVLATDRTGDAWSLVIITLTDGTLAAYRQTPFREQDVNVSPDGRWVAYVSRETGADEVFLESFPEPGNRWRVSTGGGIAPLFGPGGKDLFYLDPTNRLLSVPLTPGPDPQPGTARPLFRADIKPASVRQYDTVDGRRFLLNVEVRPEAGTPLTMVVGWEDGD
jgi:Tol biopolymer transport system component/tRNA A-37 threonylcarbamoyl transferase component Bud32